MSPETQTAMNRVLLGKAKMQDPVAMDRRALANAWAALVEALEATTNALELKLTEAELSYHDQAYYSQAEPTITDEQYAALRARLDQLADGACEIVIDEGERYETLLEAGHRLMAAFPADWRTRLRTMNRYLCQPPLPDREISLMIGTLVRGTFKPRVRVTGHNGKSLIENLMTGLKP